MLMEIEGITSIYDKAITVFLRMVRAQFFYDVYPSSLKFWGCSQQNSSSSHKDYYAALTHPVDAYPAPSNSMGINKRMGRFMMNGILLSQGYPVINLPAKKQLEFNKLMLDFYPSGNTDPMIIFMKNCLSDRVIEIMSEQ